MKTKVKRISDSRVELTITLDDKDLKPVRQKALEKLAKEVKVEGFRAGKVPLEVAEKFVPENDLNAEIMDRAVRTTVIPAFKEVETSPLVLPAVNVVKYVPGEILEYTATADIIPQVKLGDYKKLGVKKLETKVTEKDIKDTLEDIRTTFAEKKVVKRKAKLGDEVVIDFVGKKDDKAFEGGSAKDYKLTLGSKMFIPGFEDGIVDHESGDKFDLKLTFPSDYGVADLAGAKVVFEVLVKQVNEIVKPEVDEKLAAKCGPFKSIDELKADIRNNLEMQNKQRLDDKYKDDLVKALVKKSTVPVPEVLVDDQMRVIRDDVTRNAQSHGISFDDYIKRLGETNESWEKKAREIAESRVKISLVLQALATENNIVVSDDDVAAKVAELREVYKKSPEALKSLKDPNVRNDIRNRLALEKALDFLVEQNKAK